MGQLPRVQIENHDETGIGAGDQAAIVIGDVDGGTGGAKWRGPVGPIPGAHFKPRHNAGPLVAVPEGKREGIDAAPSESVAPMRPRPCALRSDRPKQPRMSLRASVGSTADGLSPPVDACAACPRDAVADDDLL